MALPRGQMFYVGLYRENVKKSSCLKPQGLAQGGGGGGGGGGTLIFSAYVGSDPASTVHPKKISEISSTLKKYLKFLQPKKISLFCIFTLRKTLKYIQIIPKTSPILG